MPAIPLEPTVECVLCHRIMNPNDDYTASSQGLECRGCEEYICAACPKFACACVADSLKRDRLRRSLREAAMERARVMNERSLYGACDDTKLGMLTAAVAALKHSMDVLDCQEGGWKY